MRPTLLMCHTCLASVALCVWDPCPQTNGHPTPLCPQLRLNFGSAQTRSLPGTYELHPLLADWKASCAHGSIQGSSWSYVRTATAQYMTMIHIRKDRKDQTAHIVSLDLLMYDSSVMTCTWPVQPREKAEWIEREWLIALLTWKTAPASSLPKARVLEAMSHMKTQTLKPSRKQLSLASFYS